MYLEPAGTCAGWTDVNRSLAVFVALAVVLLSACSDPSEPAVTDPRVVYGLKALPETPVYPADNQRNRDRFVLGWRLFFDPILSGTKDVACGTCHHSLLGMSDRRAVSLGVHAKGLGPDRSSISPLPHLTTRNSQSTVNLGFYPLLLYEPTFFWDGRARSLEEQALVPIRSRVEMRGDAYPEDAAVDSAVARLRTFKLYEIYFSRAFEEEADSVRHGWIRSTITASTLARALAAFQREIVAPNTRFDQYVRGKDDALTSQELDGLKLFFGKAECGRCHNGALLTDGKFYGQGIGNESDIGRGVVEPSKRHHFRTPSLRNLAATAPYMHDGSIGTLDDVIEYYDRGIPQTQLPSGAIDGRFRPLGLSPQEKASLRAFLGTLEDGSWEQFAVPPSTVPSGLNVPR